MQILCPECKFAREVDENKIPARSQVATCPKCQTKFKFRELPEQEFLIEEPADPAPAPTPKVTPDPKPVPPVVRKEPEQTFPDLTDPGEDSGDALWQRLHTMTPPQNGYPSPSEPHADERTPAPDDEQPPIAGWTGEFNSDFPDPMQAGTFEEEESPENPMQVPPPFEQLDRYGFFNGLFMTMKLVLFSPRLFFSVMPVGNGLSKPLTFAILVAMLQSLGQYAWTAAGIMPGIDITNPDLVATAATSADDIFMLLLRPAAVAFEMFFFAGLFHLLLLPLQSASKGFEGTFRAVAYAYTPIIIGILPMPLVELVIGGLGVGVAWFLILCAIGLKYIHGSSYLKTAGVVLLTVLLMVAATTSMFSPQLPTM
jgi:predicted Zn finger-like uncharacterized protein